MKHLLVFFFLAPLLLVAEPLRITFVLDGKSELLGKMETLFKSEINELLEPEFTVTFSTLSGDFSDPKISKILDDALADPRVDMVVAVGPVSSDTLATKKELPKPSFATLIIDQEAQKLPYVNGTSGISNLNYFTVRAEFAQDFVTFRRLVPFQNVAILIDSYMLAAIPDLGQYVKEVSAKLKIQPTIIPVINSGEEALTKLPKGTEAVFLTPLPRFTVDQVAVLLGGLIERKIPSFSSFSFGYLGKGILASTVSENELLRLSRRLALHIQGAALGDPLSKMDVVLPTDSTLAIDIKVADEMGISPPFDLLLEADLIHSNTAGFGTKMGLIDIVCLGLKNNSGLAAEYETIAIGYQELQKARSRLNGQIDIGTFGRIIDNDRAIASLGQEPAGAAFATITGSQVIYSNGLKGQVTIETYLQYAREQGYLSKRLDLILEISRAYFDVLRARTVLDIQRNNLKLTAYNLRVAKQRVEVGAARLTEVYRWESELAKSRAIVNETGATLRNSEVRLNELLEIPQESRLALQDTDLGAIIWKQLTTAAKLNLYKSYMVTKGLYLSPEIKEITDRIFASNERYNVAKRSFYTPDIALIGNLRQRYLQKGPGIYESYFDESDWEVGLGLSFPLYAGGAKVAEKRQARSQMRQLQFGMQEVREGVEKSIRQSINQAAASYANIDLSEIGSLTAKKNLELVLESYSQGTLNILDLLDAQNAALVAELEAANSVYNFYIDLITAERAVGEFDFLLPENEKLCNIIRLEQYFAEESIR